MKLYMLNPPYFPHFGRGMRWQDTGRGGTLYYPIWLSYATAVVEQEYETRLVDAPAWNWSRDDVINDVKKFKPDLIVMDSSFPSLNNDIAVAEEIKQNYDAKIALVGPPASQFSAEILNGDSVDFTARYEYDFTTKQLVETLERGGYLKDVKGLSFKESNRIINNPNRPFTNSEDLDGIPFVSTVYKKHLNIKDYSLGTSLYPEVQIFTGRGCPFKCSFCSWPQTLMGRKYRVRSIENVVDEFEYIQEELPEVKEIFIEDDTFTINTRIVLEFCEEYKRRRLNIVWACNARVGLNYETMREMKKANCRMLITGYESGTDEILQNIKKGITVEQIKQFSKNTKKAGLIEHSDFIIGLPGETKETIEMTKKLIKELKPHLLQVSVASPFPGTEFYEWCIEKEYLMTEDPNEYLDEQGHQKAIISYSELTNEEMVKEVDRILKEYYMSLNYVPLALGQILRRHGLEEMRRILRSVKVFRRYISKRGGD